MRTLLIFLSITLIYTLIQYTNGLPTNFFSSESEEDVNVETELTPELEAVSESNDQSSEEKQIVVDPPAFSEKLEVPKSSRIEDDNDLDDGGMYLADIVNDNYRRILQDDDEDD